MSPSATLEAPVSTISPQEKLRLALERQNAQEGVPVTLKYLGITVHGVITPSGQVHYNKQVFDSASGAARQAFLDIRKAVGAVEKDKTVNGWLAWRYQGEAFKEKRLLALR